MEAWQERVVQEKKELDAKIEKLFDFMCSAGYCDTTFEQRDLLRRQWSHMSDYSKILGERIAAF